MKRSKHSLSHTTLTTMDMGYLYPVSAVEVGMGDSFQGSSSALIRVSPQVAPVMHPVWARLHTFFVPFRIIWPGFEDFITGGPDGMGGSAGPYPTITAGGGGFAAGSLPDYLGVPPSVASLVISAFFVRAYNLIWNEYFRDQDLQTVALEDQLTILPVCWPKDRFTAARPWAQKGPTVSLPLGTSAPVLGIGVTTGTANTAAGANVIESSGTIPTGARVWSSANYAIEDFDNSAGNAGTGNHRPHIRADLSAATAATVSALREAMAIQRYEEARAQWGSRFPEYLRYYGIRSSDARLQRPEYLTGGKNRIAFTEVLQTADAGTPAGVGDMYGHGIAAIRQRPYLRFFEEHGVVMTLMSVIPESIYVQGLHAKFNKRIKEDYFTPELAFVGQQEIMNSEIYASAAAQSTTFGFGDRYSEYTEEPSQVTGEMRGTSMDFWHYGRKFGAPPTLNASFVSGADVTKRVYQVSTNQVLWVQVLNRIRARRMVQSNPKARII